MISDRSAAGPSKMTGKEFEEFLMREFRSLTRAGYLEGERNGVQAVQYYDQDRQLKVSTRASMPDMTGAFQLNGRRFDFDAKVCGDVSFPLHYYAADHKGKKGKRRRQLTHGYKYARMRAVEGFAIHFTARPGGPRSAPKPQETWFLPIHPDMAFWKSFEKGDYRSLNRSEIADWAIPVKWYGFSSQSPDGRPGLRDTFEAAIDLLRTYWD